MNFILSYSTKAEFKAEWKFEASFIKSNKIGNRYSLSGLTDYTSLLVFFSAFLFFISSWSRMAYTYKLFNYFKRFYMHSNKKQIYCSILLCEPNLFFSLNTQSKSIEVLRAIISTKKVGFVLHKQSSLSWCCGKAFRNEYLLYVIVIFNLKFWKNRWAMY